MALASLALWLAGCSGLQVPGIGAQQPTEPSPAVTLTSATLPAPPSPAPTQTSAGTPTAPGPVTIVLWVPPQFDPQSSTPVGKLLKERLVEFGARRPDVRVDVRTKAVEGPGGMLDALATASAAAPEVLPNLVALPRPVFEAAALKGLLFSLDGLTTALDDPDWFEFARQLATLQGSVYGLPISGDALALAYRSDAVTPPATWQSALDTQSAILFAVEDPQASVALALYQATGGQVVDEQGKPFLESDQLEYLFAFFQQAQQAGVMPSWTAQLESDDQVWVALGEGRANMAITRVSYYLNSPIPNIALAPLPTPGGEAFTLTSGWVWALASAEVETQKLSVQLAEFLTDSSFLASWNEAGGSLPPRPSALDGWEDAALRSLLEKIAVSAHLFPSTDVTNSLGPVLEQATVKILKQETDPATALKTALEALESR